MGKWNRRWIPRKRYYQETPESLHWRYHTQPEPSGVWENSVPSWEKQFCTLVGSIPWGKVVATKKYMSYCHNNVVEWHDSAGEEAFNNAKERFRAAINGLPCDIPLPDPDMYIDEIDWNPRIDPELILDLDREYFNPDEGGKDNKVETLSQKAHNLVSNHAVGWHDNLNNSDNPWEGSDVNGTGASKVEHGWNQWGGSTNGWRNTDNAKNPWGQSYTQDNVALPDNTWGNCGDKSRGWNQDQTCNDQSKNFDSPWGRGCQHIGSAKEKGWGGAVNNSWGWVQRESNIHESRKFISGATSWKHTLNQGNGGGKDREWANRGGKSWGWKQCGDKKNEPKRFDSRINGGASGIENDGCRKREGSHQYSSRYKSSRFQGDDYGTNHHWRRG